MFVISMRVVGFVMCYQPIVFDYKVDELFYNCVANLVKCGSVNIAKPGVSAECFEGR